MLLNGTHINIKSWLQNIQTRDPMIGPIQLGSMKVPTLRSILRCVEAFPAASIAPDSCSAVSNVEELHYFPYKVIEIKKQGSSCIGRLW